MSKKQQGNSNSREVRVERLKAHRFKKGESGNKSGRPRKFVTIMAGKEGLKRSEINDIIQGLAGLTVAELKAIFTDPQSRALEVVVAKAIASDIQAGRMINTESILSRAFGTPKQEVQMNVRSTVKNVHMSIPDNEKSDEGQAKT